MSDCADACSNGIVPWQPNRLCSELMRFYFFDHFWKCSWISLKFWHCVVPL